MSKYVVIDLEMCRVPKSFRTVNYPWSRETIQIGAVMINDSLEIEDEFNTYVAPEYGYIDDFIKRLTGITKSDIKDAVDMADALKMLLDWAPKDAKFVSWSDTDYVQINREIQAKNIKLERFDEMSHNWIDCQLIFSEDMSGRMNEDYKKYALKEALIAADICFDENIHNGLVDARNTAELFIKMKKEPILQLNSYYEYAKTGVKNEEEDQATLGDLFPWLGSLYASA